MSIPILFFIDNKQK